MTEIVMRREDPPERKHGRRAILSDRLEAAGALAKMRKYGKWYLVLTVKSANQTGQTKRALEKQLPDFEWTTRGVNVYGRYVGEKEA